MGRYSIVVIGGFGHGSYTTIKEAKRMAKHIDYYGNGMYQIIDTKTGFAVFEGKLKHKEE